MDDNSFNCVMSGSSLTTSLLCGSLLRLMKLKNDFSKMANISKHQLWADSRFCWDVPIEHNWLFMHNIIDWFMHNLDFNERAVKWLVKNNLFCLLSSLYTFCKAKWS
jgi:hypothetical protein